MWKMLALLLVGCGTAPSALELEGDENVVVHALDSVPLPAVTALDAGGQAMPGALDVAWSVAPEGVARLSADGASVELLGEGTATITAAVGDVSDAFTVTVSLPDAVAFDSSALAGVAVGQVVSLTAQVTADGTPIAGAPIVWSVSDPAVATISESGEFTVVAAGTVTVTATSGELTSTFEVTAAPAATAEELAEGEAAQGQAI